MSFLLIIVSVIPIILLGLYIYNKDTEKEPKSLLIELFSSGLVSSFIVVVINMLTALLIPDFYLSDNYSKFTLFELFILIFLEIALVEELSKWLMIRFLGYQSKEFDQPYDIIVYAVFVSLGFAAVENIMYVMQGGITVGLYRALFSVPGHAAFGVFMGYFLGLAKVYQKKDKFKYRLYIFLSIFIPALIHTIYNFLLMLESFYCLIIFIGFMIVLYMTAIKEINDVVNDDILLK